MWAYLIQKDILKAAKCTLVAKAAPEPEEREEIYKKLVIPAFTEAHACLLYTSYITASGT